MKRFLAGGVAAIACLAGATAAGAAPVQWTTASGGNGHFYELVASDSGNVSWYGAWGGASARTLDGQQGYLATVTSAEENAFLVSISSSLAWIGGSDDGEEGSFIWMGGPEAGEAFTFTAWNSGEPNNFNGENFVQINWGSAGRWNDAPGTADGDTATAFYFVEYGGFGTGGGGAVPEPAAWALMITGFGGAGAMLRRRRERLAG